MMFVTNNCVLVLSLLSWCQGGVLPDRTSQNNIIRTGQVSQFLAEVKDYLSRQERTLSRSLLGADHVPCADSLVRGVLGKCRDYKALSNKKNILAIHGLNALIAKRKKAEKEKIIQDVSIKQTNEIDDSLQSPTKSVLGLLSENDESTNNLTKFGQRTNMTSNFNEAYPIQSLHNRITANEVAINATNLALTDKVESNTTLTLDGITDLIQEKQNTTSITKPGTAINYPLLDSEKINIPKTTTMNIDTNTGDKNTSANHLMDNDSVIDSSTSSKINQFINSLQSKGSSHLNGCNDTLELQSTTNNLLENNNETNEVSMTEQTITESITIKELPEDTTTVPSEDTTIDITIPDFTTTDITISDFSTTDIIISNFTTTDITIPDLTTIDIRLSEEKNNDNLIPETTSSYISISNTLKNTNLSTDNAKNTEKSPCISSCEEMISKFNLIEYNLQRIPGKVNTDLILEKAEKLNHKENTVSDKILLDVSKENASESRKTGAKPQFADSIPRSPSIMNRITNLWDELAHFFGLQTSKTGRSNLLLLLKLEDDITERRESANFEILPNITSTIALNYTSGKFDEMKNHTIFTVNSSTVFPEGTGAEGNKTNKIISTPTMFNGVQDKTDVTTMPKIANTKADSFVHNKVDEDEESLNHQPESIIHSEKLVFETTTRKTQDDLTTPATEEPENTANISAESKVPDISVTDIVKEYQILEAESTTTNILKTEI